MKKAAAGLLVFLLAAALFAGRRFPAPRGLVTDEARVLDDSGRDRLQRLLTDIETQTAAEVAVVTIPSLNGDGLDDYSNELFKAWGIGKKGKDNGVLVLVAANDHKVRIETGYGAEGVLPDGRCGEIIRTDITPWFKSGNFPEGLYRGAVSIGRALGATIQEPKAAHVPLPRQAPAPVPAPDRAGDWLGFLSATVFGVIFGGGLGWIGVLIILVLASFQSRLWLALATGFAAGTIPWGAVSQGAGFFTGLVAGAVLKRRFPESFRTGRSGRGGRWSGGGFSGGSGGGGGFGGGSSGGGGASGSW